MRWWNDDRRPDLDQRTDRLARRLMLGHPVERDTYFWARLRATLALRECAKVMKRELTPAFTRLARVTNEAAAQMERFGAAFRR